MLNSPMLYNGDILLLFHENLSDEFFFNLAERTYLTSAYYCANAFLFESLEVGHFGPNVAQMGLSNVKFPYTL